MFGVLEWIASTAAECEAGKEERETDDEKHRDSQEDYSDATVNKSKEI